MRFVMDLEKARPTKYKRRWKDAKGRWQYEYHEPHKPKQQLGLFESPAKPAPEAKPSAADVEHAASVERYEEKQEAKRERYENRAERARAEADSARATSDQMASAIPMGQPILVGHHSEKRHRRDLAKIRKKAQQEFDARKKAEHYDRKAKGVGTGGISSDDPAAVQKLQKEIDSAEEMRATIKGINAAYRKHKGDWAKVQQATGIPDRLVESGRKMMRANPNDKIPFPSYTLTNMGANIRRMKKRIEHLRSEAATPEAAPVEGNGYRIEESKEDNRIRFYFDTKPSRDVTKKMKSAGFRWSPTNGAWQRHLNAGGRYAADRMRKELFPEAEAFQEEHEVAAAAPLQAGDRARWKDKEGIIESVAEEKVYQDGWGGPTKMAPVAWFKRDDGVEGKMPLADLTKVEKSIGDELFTIPLRKALGQPEMPLVILEKASAMRGTPIGGVTPGGKLVRVGQKEYEPIADFKRRTSKPQQSTGERSWVDHRPGLPDQTIHKYATVVGKDKSGDDLRVYNGVRKDLHDSIVKSFVQGKKPPGGKKVAMVMMGGAASGKTSLLEATMGDKFDSFVNVNPDDVKGKIPEYRAALEFKRGGQKVSAKDAAWMAHEESSDVATEIYNQALEQGLDMIVDGTGKNGPKHQAKIAALKAEGYEVHMVMPHLHKADALNRVEQRAKRTGRFVPDPVVSEQYDRIPGNFEASARMADSFKLYDNSVPKGSPAILKWSSPPEVVHDQAFVDHFKTKGASAPFQKAEPSGIPWDKLDADNFLPQKGKRLRYS